MLMPEKRFEIKAVETDYKSKDLNPTYYKDFKMYVLQCYLVNPEWVYIGVGICKDYQLFTV